MIQDTKTSLNILSLFIDYNNFRWLNYIHNSRIKQLNRFFSLLLPIVVVVILNLSFRVLSVLPTCWYRSFIAGIVYSNEIVTNDKRASFCCPIVLFLLIYFVSVSVILWHQSIIIFYLWSRIILILWHFKDVYTRKNGKKTNIEIVCNHRLWWISAIKKHETGTIDFT